MLDASAHYMDVLLVMACVVLDVHCLCFEVSVYDQSSDYQTSVVGSSVWLWCIVRWFARLQSFPKTVFSTATCVWGVVFRNILDGNSLHKGGSRVCWACGAYDASFNIYNISTGAARLPPSRFTPQLLVGLETCRPLRLFHSCHFENLLFSSCPLCQSVVIHHSRALDQPYYLVSVQSMCLTVMGMMYFPHALSVAEGLRPNT